MASVTGTPTNKIARIAGDGEILLSTRARAALDDRVEVGPAVELTLKGFHEPVEVYRLRAPCEDAPG